MTSFPRTDRLVPSIRRLLRLRRYSRRTEDAYVTWVKRFVRFHGNRHPREMAEAEIEAFLVELTERRQVSAGTQNQALAALLFMYHHPQIGPKFLERFYTETDLTYFSDFRQGTDWLASGKYPLCFLCRLRRAMEQGLPVAEISPYNFKEAPGIGSNNGAIALMNNQPHPNGARVFINWYLSRDGQIAFRNANNTLEDETTTSLREDLPASVVPEAARRRKDVDYLEIIRYDWMDWKPVGDLINAARQKSGK